MKMHYLFFGVIFSAVIYPSFDDLHVDQERLQLESSNIVDLFLQQHKIDSTAYDVAYQFTNDLGNREHIKPDFLRTLNACGFSEEQAYRLVYGGAVLRLTMSSKDVFNLECRSSGEGKIYGRCWVVPAGGYRSSSVNKWY